MAFLENNPLLSSYVADDSSSPSDAAMMSYAARLKALRDAGRDPRYAKLGSIPELTPSDQESLIHKLTHTGLSALSVLGNTLGTLGGGVRGLITGLAKGEGLGAIGSGFRSLYDWNYRPTGQEMLQALGASDGEDTWANWFKGLGADILTDPLTYVTGPGKLLGIGGRAYTPAGRALQKTALLGDELQTVGTNVATRMAKAAQAEAAAQGLAGKAADAFVRKKIGSVAASNINDLTGGVKAVGSNWLGKNVKYSDVVKNAETLANLGDTAMASRLRDLEAMGLPASYMDMPIAKDIGVRLPFMESQAGFNLPNFVTDAADRAKHLLRYGTPLDFVKSYAGWIPGVGQAISNKIDKIHQFGEGFSPGQLAAQMFSTPMRGTYGYASQLAMPEVLAAARRAGISTSRESFDYMDVINNIIKDAKDAQGNPLLRPEDVDKLIYGISEGVFNPATGGGLGSARYATTLDDLYSKIPQQHLADFQRILGDSASAKDAIYAWRNLRGMTADPLKDIEGFIHTPRMGAGEMGHFAPPGPKEFNLGMGGANPREKLLKAWTSGTGGINEFFEQNAGSALSLQALKDRLLKRYGVSDWGDDLAADRALKIAEWAKELPAGQTKMYAPWVEAMHRYGVQGRSANSAAIEAAKFLYRNQSAEGVPMSQVLEKLGWETPEGAIGLAGATLEGVPQGMASALKHLKVPERIAEQATQFLTKGQPGSYMNPLTKVVDSMQSLSRAMLTSPFISFHMRNLTSGVANALMNRAGGHMGEANRMIMAGEAPEWLAKLPWVQRSLQEMGGLPATSENLLKAVQRELFAHNTVGSFTAMGINDEIPILQRLMQSLPGNNKFDLWKTVKSWFPHSLKEADPTAVRGFWNNVESKFAPVKAGEQLGWYGETMNRLPPFLSGLKKGLNPTAADELVALLQPRYGAQWFTPFENKWMKRIDPFYGFNRQMMKNVVNTLGDEPGGAIANAIKAAASLSSSGEVIPDYVAQGLSIPIGKNAEGGPRVLGGLGLMHEQSANLLGNAIKAMGGLAEGRSGELGNLMAELGTHMRPEMKLPAEIAFRRSLFQRGMGGPRELEEQDPILGRLAANIMGERKAYKFPWALEDIVANSPASRWLSSAKFATDWRKRPEWQRDMPGFIPGMGYPALLKAFGLRTVDISPAAQEKIVRDATEEAFRETGLAKMFHKVSLDKELLAQLSDPAEAIDAMKYQAILNLLDRRAQQAARGMPVSPLGLGGLVSNRLAP